MLELKPGMTAIQVNKREELPDAIRSVMEAVKQGELDIQIEDVAEQGTAELRLIPTATRSNPHAPNRACRWIVSYLAPV